MQTSATSLAERLAHGLIVSCHADAVTDIDATDLLRMYAAAAEGGGAVGVRIEGADAVKSVRAKTALPIIGFVKGSYADGSELITPSLDDIGMLFDAGADIVAIDVTRRKRPDGSDGFQFFDDARRRFERALWADCSQFREGVHAAEAGADFVATTLSGYTPATADANHSEPDYDMIRELALSLVIPVIAEGRIWAPDAARRALEAGAHAVVVGSAITRPSLITRMFTDALQPAAPSS